MIIDAHVHVWDLSSASYSWLTDAVHPLDRTVLLDEFPSIRPATRIILVQAADNASDTAVMRAQAELDPRVVGIVAWVPLDQPHLVAELAQEYANDPLIVGVRNLIHERAAGWLAGAAQTESLNLLANAGLTLDFVTADHAALCEVPALADRHPGLRIVIDHLGKPPLAGDARARAAWRSALADAATRPTVFAKASGLLGPADPLSPGAGHPARPFVDTALDLFGADRVMYGSDWPLVELVEDHRKAFDLVASAAGDRGGTSLTSVLSDTAAYFYDIHGLDS
ncbi:MULTISPECIES: amidohydrolase family protein [Plantibacter]|uniref:amidohydrolase family protein n=1 Tax=Plantibacter TaxID=190323 RepID=UPI001375740B|nr:MULTISPECIES: amidohydrolase family protein [Plantibacter]MBD8103892.1 amidohydrolase family protein [Plantibacter sp. CFBP 8775]MBD8467340.1 amidohydrolase family protein [Plantibacter sp. CFBP 8798]